MIGVCVSQEKRVVAPIRCGGVPKSYDRQLLLVGDAAGHVDPLTGERVQLMCF
jgi:flavin-dependent dehydrogenase